MSFNFKNKSGNIKTLNIQMLNKTASMFEYEGLPETIPYFELEKILQMNGYGFITEYQGKLYCFSGSLGGEQDAYLNYKDFIISNAPLNLFKQLSIADDGVLIKNDDYMQGLLPIFERYNTFIVENDINIMLYGYNTRTQKLLSASDDKTKQSAELFIKRSVDGDIAIIGENGMFEGVKLHAVPSSQSGGINSLIELQQYLKGSMFNEVGLSATFNMKRERLLSSEVDQSEGSLLALVYNMLKCRLEAIEKINAKYNLQIKIKLGGVWEVKKVATEGDANPIINKHEAGAGNDKQKPTTTKGAGAGAKESPDESGGGNPSESNPETDKQTLTLTEIDELLLDESLTDEEIAYLQLQKETLLSKGVE